AGVLYCQCCGRPVKRDTAESIYADLMHRARAVGDPRLMLSFPVPVPKSFEEREIRELLAKQGYTRIFELPATPPAAQPPPAKAPAGRRKGKRAAAAGPAVAAKVLQVVQDRFRAGNVER